MLGQKKTKEDDLNTVTLSEFLGHYPQLHRFMLEQLQKSVAGTRRKFYLHPSLFPVLIILSKLNASVSVRQELR